MTRTPPKIPLSQPKPGYATLLYHNFDYWQEALNLKLPTELEERLENGKQEAADLDERLKGTVLFEFGGERFELRATGSKSKRYLLFNDDIRFEIGSPKCAWSINWRATAAALAEYGVQVLRNRVYACVKKAGFLPNTERQSWEERWYTLTRCDYAFDFYSPAFRDEMVPDLANNIVAQKGIKYHLHGTSTRRSDGKVSAETLDIGSKASCQVEIYDKVKEIREASGKDWMYEIWGEHGGYWPEEEPEDVWRLEVRIAGDWLKDRTEKKPENVLSSIWELIAEALYNRRLTLPTPGDNNRWRHPLHPLYSLVIQELECPKEFLPVGRRLTSSREELNQTLIANAAGTIRSALVLREGFNFTEQETRDLAAQIIEQMQSDAKHFDKKKRAEARYEFIDEAR